MLTRLIGLAVVLLTLAAARLEPLDGQRRGSVPARRTEALADFRDLAAAAGLSARTVIGGERTKDYILETTGGGLAIVDYDNDGWPDIFLVNGGRLPGPAQRRRAREPSVSQQRGRHVRRRDGQGRRRRPRLGTGCRGRRLRQRRAHRPVRHLLRPRRALSQQRRRHLQRCDARQRRHVLQPPLEHGSGVPGLRPRRPSGPVRLGVRRVRATRSGTRREAGRSASGRGSA